MDAVSFSDMHFLTKASFGGFVQSIISPFACRIVTSAQRDVFMNCLLVSLFYFRYVCSLNDSIHRGVICLRATFCHLLFKSSVLLRSYETDAFNIRFCCKDIICLALTCGQSYWQKQLILFFLLHLDFRQLKQSILFFL